MTVPSERASEERYLIRGPLPLVVVVVVLVAALAGSIWLMLAWSDRTAAERARVRPTEDAQFLREVFGIETRAVVGVDLARFDPVAALAQASALAGEGAELVALEAAGVRRDGTIDLSASATSRAVVVYSFRRRLAAPPPTATPAVVSGGDAWYEPVVVIAEAPGRRRFITRNCCPRRGPGPWALNVEIVNAGLLREPNPPTIQPLDLARPPACPFASLWQQAVARGAPPEALARVQVEPGAVQFHIDERAFRLTSGPDCQARAVAGRAETAMIGEEPSP